MRDDDRRHVLVEEPVRLCVEPLHARPRRRSARHHGWPRPAPGSARRTSRRWPGRSGSRGSCWRRGSRRPSRAGRCPPGHPRRHCRGRCPTPVPRSGRRAQVGLELAWRSPGRRCWARAGSRAPRRGTAAGWSCPPRHVGVRQQLLGGLGIERMGILERWSGAPVGDGAGGEVGRDLRPGRVEVVDDPLPVDAHGDRLADVRVIPRRNRVVHAQVERVETLARVELEVRVTLDGRQVLLGRVVDAVHRPGLQLDEALRRLAVPAERPGWVSWPSPQYSSKAVKVMRLPRSHSANWYGPVPLGRTSSVSSGSGGGDAPSCGVVVLSGMLSMRYCASSMPSALKATCERNATWPQNSKTTVIGSGPTSS